MNPTQQIQREEIPYFEDKKDPVQPDKPTIERNMVQVILYNPKKDEFLGIQWHNFDWKTLIIGGIEDGEDSIAASMREIKEETGYVDVKFIAEIGKTRAAFYAANKDVNRIANTTGLLFELMSDTQKDIAAEEKSDHFYKWLPKNEALDFLNIEPQRYIWQKFISNPSLLI